MLAATPVHEVDVLLVEDNGSHAELVRRAFESHGVTTRLRHVRDGQEALDYLFRRGTYADPEASPRPKVVLLDLRLPKMDGLDVLSAVRESPELSKLPVVVLTTSAAESDVSRAYDRKVNSYLVKPTDFEEFERLILDLGTYWLHRNEPPWRQE